MDAYSGKRAANGVVASRKEFGLILKDRGNNRDRNGQFCNRLGCSGRLNSARGARGSYFEKSATPSFRASSNGKEIVGSSSRNSSTVSNPNKSIVGSHRKLSSGLETDSSETSSMQDEPEVTELIPPPQKIQKGLNLGSKSPHSSETVLLDGGSSSVASNVRSKRTYYNQRSGVRNHDTRVGSSASSISSKLPEQSTRAGKNLGLKSISDSIQLGSSSSSSDSNLTRRKEATNKNRNSEGESSSATKGKKTSWSSLEGRNTGYSYRISRSDSSGARNNIPPHRENGVASSVRTRRSVSGQNRSSRLTTESSLPLNEPPIMFSEISRPNISIDVNAPSSSRQLSSDLTSSHSDLTSSHSNGEVGLTCSYMNQGSFRHYNIDGIAEVLLALERIEQDEELTYEQVILLESNLFLNGLSFYDQHRDMRLDIDNMSYEELLALEDRMGTVSTAMTEEALAQCLQSSIYQLRPVEDTALCCREDKDDVKCCICQEEYAIGDEIGKLQCEHSFHLVCVKQWLRLKNWCPICKATAGPTSTSLSPHNSVL